MRNHCTLLILAVFALALPMGAMAEEAMSEAAATTDAEPTTGLAGSPEELLPASRCGGEEEEDSPGDVLPMGELPMETAGIAIAEVPMSAGSCEGLCLCGPPLLGGCCQCPKGSTSGTCCPDGACTIGGDPICFSAPSSCTCFSPDPD